MTTLEWFRSNKSSHSWTMTLLFNYVKISKQAHHKQLRRKQEFELLSAGILEECIRIRQDHPRIGARKLYSMINPDGRGRDRFEQKLFDNGLKLQRKKSYTRTTHSHPWYRYENLLSGRKVYKPYQILVSDITYLRIGLNDFHYLVLIQDI